MLESKKIKYDFKLIETNVEYTFSHKEYLSFSYLIRKIYRDLGYSIRKGMVYKKHKLKSSFLLFPLSIIETVDEDGNRKIEVVVSFINFYFHKTDKEVTFRHVPTCDAGHGLNLNKIEIDRVTDKFIKKTKENLLNRQTCKFKYTSYELNEILKAFNNILYGYIPVIRHPIGIGWVKVNNEFIYEPVHNSHVGESTYRKYLYESAKRKNNYISEYLEGFDEYKSGSAERILSLKFTPTDILFFACTLLSLSNFFYNNVYEFPKFCIYIIPKREDRLVYCKCQYQNAEKFQHENV